VKIGLALLALAAGVILFAKVANDTFTWPGFNEVD
jgi:hypothetical protein